jgi:hypothetical protein
MPRELTDADGIRWTCAQPYAGLSDEAGDKSAARVAPDRYEVVCTPSGGAQTVRLELTADWETALDDEALLAKIKENQ